MIVEVGGWNMDATLMGEFNQKLEDYWRKSRNICGACELAGQLCREHDTEHDTETEPVVRDTHTSVRVGPSSDYQANHWVVCEACEEEAVSDDCSIYETSEGKWTHVCVWCEGQEEGR
jgi:hypothetical protein